LPDFLEPMKAKLLGTRPAGDRIYEIKFDGYRALALRGGAETRILSRNGGRAKRIQPSSQGILVR